MNQHLRKIQCFFSVSAFFVSSLIIFNPIHKSGNPAVSLTVFLITGTLLISVICSLYKKIQNIRLPLSLYGTISILCCTLSVILSLILLTQVIKDTSYIANKNVSMLYYTLFTFFVLCVSLYLCSKGYKGIYRFCIICCIFFVLLIILSFSVFVSTKGFSKDAFDINTQSNFLNDILAGFKSGIFMTFDSIVFLFCFFDYLKDKSGKIYKSVITSAFFTSFFYFFILYIILLLTFGKEILKNIEYPVYSLLKLVYGFDAVDLLSFTLIPAYMIKSSVYIYSSAVCLNNAIKHGKNHTKIIIVLLHASIPVILTITALFFKHLGYGAFQDKVYIINALFCALFLFLISKLKNN